MGIFSSGHSAMARVGDVGNADSNKPLMIAAFSNVELLLILV